MKQRTTPWLAVLMVVGSGCTPQYWESTSPGGGGYFMRIAAGVSGVVIACSDLSGAYRSLDRGQSWEPIGPERGLTETHAASVAFHATNLSLVYIGSEDGLFRSRDFAQTFEVVLDHGYIEHVAVAPTDEQVVYAAYHAKYNACGGEVYRSNNGGDTWAKVSTNLPADHRVLEILVDPTDAGTIYVLTGKGRFNEAPCVINRSAFRSEDFGATYTEIGAGFSKLVDIALDPHNPLGLFAADEGGFPPFVGWSYKSADRGQSWTYLDAHGGFLWPHASNPNVLRTIQGRIQYEWLSASGVWESNQGGALGTWQKKSFVEDWIGGWSPVYWAFNASSLHGAMAADPSDPNAVWWAGSQFVYASFDGGATVQQMFSREVGGPGSNRWRSRGVDNVVPVDVAVNRANPLEIYAGFLDLGTWCSLDGGESWQMRNQFEVSGSWLGGGANTFCVETDPERPGVVWATQGESHTGPASLLRSLDTGQTWSVPATGLPAAALIGLSLDPSSPVQQRTLYVTSAGNVYASTDEGASFALRFANGGLRFTAVDPADGSIVYAGGEAGLWRSNNSGATGSWSKVGLAEMGGGVSGLPSTHVWVGVYDIEPDPSVAGRIYVSVHGAGKGLYRSDDYGTTFAPRLIADNHLRGVAVDPGNSNVVYATSSSALNAGGYASDSNGVWYSSDAGTTFERRNDGLTWPLATAIDFGPAGSDVLFLASPGTGIHRLKARTLSADSAGVSASTGGTVGFTLTAGQSHADRPYLLLASTAKSATGLPLAPGISLGLANDWLLGFSIQFANSNLFQNTFGTLDPLGQASASLHIGAGQTWPLLGLQLQFAYVTLLPIDFASETVGLLIIP